ncbi:NEL-type E3 ubiquitin ligase domain-containing protein [Pseudomonas huaxiensis]|uniref:NEL-type E3 ubiquitin ligase domain-containing protein n=1 Tax=Pseudomonas huaxiensis TaxID=2213017 RepID=UPI000DA683B9|nr:NEL-type E3 ubiquitin ligase domain-containing protein [Pseudomonas huaxiensis]
MSNSIDAIPPRSETPVVGDSAYEVVRRRAPTWLTSAPREVRAAVRNMGPDELSWFAKALSDHPQVADQLQRAYAKHRHFEDLRTSLLARIPDLEAFAEPLLTAAIEQQFNLNLDVRTTWLFHAGRSQTDESFMAVTKDPWVQIALATKAATQSLLGAALQNFQAWEAEPGGMRQSRLKSSIYIEDGTAQHSTSVEIEPEAFAMLCRTLDLGGQYRALIDSVLDSAVKDEEGKSFAFDRFEGSALLLHAHTAYMKRAIGQPLYDTLVKRLSHPHVAQTAKPLLCSFLTLWGVELTGILIMAQYRAVESVIGYPQWMPDYRDGPILAYLPDDPFDPLKEYPSLQAFHDALRDKLLQPRYSKFFERFVPARHRHRLFSELGAAFYPKVWNPRGFYEQGKDSEAALVLGTQVVSGALLTGLVQQKIAVLRDDASFLAVATADQDQKTREERLRYVANVAVNTLNIAALTMPGLGALMLAITGAQLAYDVYEGFDSLSRGEREQGWAYLMDVVENLAQVAALGAVSGAGAAVPALEVPAVVRGMRTVLLGDGSTRLWKPDLRPFAHDIVLPAGLQPDSRGLYHYQGRQWLPLDGSIFRVTSNPPGSAHFLEHPDRADAYQPTLRSNGAGAWLHELDQPLEWEGVALFQRMGPLAQGLSEQTARLLLWGSDIHPAQLRRALANSERPPALLTDTLQRFRLDQALDGAVEALSPAARRALFNAHYAALQGSPGAEVQQLTKTFTGLPAAVAEELLAHADASERVQLSNERKVPLRLAEEARAYQQKVRLARACEGLYLDAVGSPDSDRLVLRSVAALPGWSPEVRLEVRSRAVDGPLIDSVGPAEAPIRQVLLKDGEGYRVARPDNSPAPSSADDLLCAVIEALPMAQRDALGVGLGGKALLRRLLLAQPLPSLQWVRQVLQMQPGRPGVRSPMRLADGRLGYPLSGRGALADYVTEDTLQDRIRQLGFQDAFAEDILRELYSAGLGRPAISDRLDQLFEEQRVLGGSLEQWRQAQAVAGDPGEARTAARERIAEAVWAHWRGNNLPEIGRSARALQLESITVSDFPDHLPAFVLDRVQGLVLRDVTVPGAGLVSEADGQFSYEAMLPRFLQRFAQVRSLEIHRGFGWPVVDLPRSVASSCPRLRRLHLNDVHLTLTPDVLVALSGLNELRHLDLSGNVLLDAAHLSVAGFDLDFLGLDRVGMTRWPQWLDRQALSRISRLSLVDNHLVELPEHVLQNQADAGHHTRIVLNGNVFSRQSILNARLSEGSGRRFSFDLDIPDTLQSDLDVRLREQGLLSEAIDAWQETSSSTQLLNEARRAARHRVAENYLNFWREESQGNTSSILQLDSLALDDAPQRLPVFFYQRVRRLELLNSAGTPEMLDHFLAEFPHLEGLAISGLEHPVTHLPNALQSMRELRSLALIDVGLLVDQRVMEAIAALPRLSSLELDGNTLGTITDLSSFGDRQLDLLSLNAMGIDTWPAWLDQLVPLRVEVLSLASNQISVLPEYLLENHRNPDAFTEISLLGNPLTHETMRRAFISIADNRPFVFEMDFPEDIRQLRVEPHPSDSDEFASSSGHSHGAGTSSDEEDDLLDDWLIGNVDENEARRATWQQLEHCEEAADLLQMIGRLRHTADYRSAGSRPELVARVWRVLDATARDVELRLTLNGMAQEPLRQLRNYDTCPDGIRLEFNQMEIQVFIRQSLLEVAEQQRGPTLYRLMRRLYRLQALDTIAREQAGTRDEAEVRLAYRLHWAEELDLPVPPGRMLYRTIADVRPAELDRALDRVRQGEGGQLLLDYAAQRDFWVGYLREAHGERFKAIKEVFEARVLELIDLYPEDSPQRSSERIRALEAQFQQDERNLIDELTNREGLACN